MDLFKKPSDPVTLRAVISNPGISFFLVVGSWMVVSASMTLEPNLDALQFVFAHAATGQGPAAIPVVAFGLMQITLLYILYRDISAKARPTQDQRYTTKQVITSGGQMFKTESRLSAYRRDPHGTF